MCSLLNNDLILRLHEIGIIFLEDVPCCPEFSFAIATVPTVPYDSEDGQKMRRPWKESMAV